MSRTLSKAARRGFAAAGAVVAASALLVAPSTTASAATMKCSDRQFKLITARYGDVEAWVETCVVRNDNGSHQAAIKLSMHTTVHPSDKLFHSFKVVSRLERNDVVQKSTTCDLTAQANQPSWWTAKCRTPVSTSTARNGWTSDGYLTWDVIDDGRGAWRWELAGSPSVP